MGESPLEGEGRQEHGRSVFSGTRRAQEAKQQGMPKGADRCGSVDAALRPGHRCEELAGELVEPLLATEDVDNIGPLLH